MGKQREDRAVGAQGAAQRFERLGQEATWLNERSYFRYVRAMWRSTAAFGWYHAGLTLFRRIRLLRLIWRIVYGLWTALKTGTLLLLLLPFLLILVPGVVLLSLLMLVGGLLELRRLRRVMTARMRDKTVVLLSADSGMWEARAGAFFRGQLRELNATEGVLTVVRSPYLLSGRGFGGRGFYWAVRHEGKRLYLTRSLGFFALRRIACGVARQVVYVA